MSKKSVLLLVTAVTLSFCPRCNAQSGGYADASGGSYAPADSYRLPRADGNGGLRGPVDNSGVNGNNPISGMRGPADNGFNANAGQQFGTQDATQYGNQYGA